MELLYDRDHVTTWPRDHGGFDIGGVEFPSDGSADDRPYGGDNDGNNNNNSIQLIY
jgi:hypothetical protein